MTAQTTTPSEPERTTNRQMRRNKNYYRKEKQRHLLPWEVKGIFGMKRHEKN